MKNKGIVVGVAALTLAAGCSSSGRTPPRRSPVTSTATTKAFVTAYGQDAALVASHITGCTGVTAGSIGNGAATGMVSKATCTLDGHQVILYTWKDAASESSAESITTASMKFHASGTGWTQILGDDAAQDAQRSIATTVAHSLGGTVSG